MTLRMSADRARPEVSGGWSKRRDSPKADIGHIDQHANLRYRLQINFWLGEV
jgi:hypothetical protein